MHRKRKNFISRLLGRHAAEEASDTDAAAAMGTAENTGEAGDRSRSAEDEPTICRNGKKYRARWRNGRWESFGAPVGDC